MQRAAACILIGIPTGLGELNLRVEGFRVSGLGFRVQGLVQEGSIGFKSRHA